MAPLLSQARTRATGTTRLVLPLFCSVLAYALMQTLLVPTLPIFARVFRVDTEAVGWALTTFLLAGAVASPVLGSLGDRYGHRRILLVMLGTFVIGALISLDAPDYPLLLAGRVLQGASTASYPLSLAIVRHHLPP